MIAGATVEEWFRTMLEQIAVLSMLMPWIRVATPTLERASEWLRATVDMGDGNFISTLEFAVGHSSLTRQFFVLVRKRKVRSTRTVLKGTPMQPAIVMVVVIRCDMSAVSCRIMTLPIRIELSGDRTGDGKESASHE
jgi:hypothetical protein